MLFNYESFKRLLNIITDDYHYSFRLFDECDEPESGQIIYLRYDIDISPYNAMRLGEIEHDINIRANFFFQISIFNLIYFRY